MTMRSGVSRTQRLLEELRRDYVREIGAERTAEYVCQSLGESLAELMEGTQDEIVGVCQDNDDCIEKAWDVGHQAVDRLCQMYQAQADDFINMAQRAIADALRSYLYYVQTHSSWTGGPTP